MKPNPNPPKKGAPPPRPRGDGEEDAILQEFVRQKARDDLMSYILACDPKYQPSKIHHYLARVLMLVEQLKLRRVIITMPRRHGKSKLACENFLPWCLGRNPEMDIITASYGAQRSNKTSFQVRKRMESNQAHGLIFPNCKVSDERRRVEAWMTTEGGEFLSSGVGGGITGHGSSGLLLDDLHKNRQEAESQINRDKVWDWFLGDAMNTLSADAWVVIIGTRYNDDDVIGRLLNPAFRKDLEDAGMGAENFKLFNFPAECVEDKDVLGRRAGEASTAHPALTGDPLWPERWGVKELAAKKKFIGSYEWEAQFQQNPRKRGGLHLRREWFKAVKWEDVPKGMQWSRGWDLAASANTAADHTASVKGAKEPDSGNFYLADGFFGKCEWPMMRRKASAIAMAEKIRVGVEAQGGIKTAADDFKDHLSGVAVVELVTTNADKLTRALPWIALAEAGKVHLVEGPWTEEFLRQCERFTGLKTDKRDDYIDATSIVHDMCQGGSCPVLVF